MTKSFGIAEEEVAKNAGIIASSLFVGRIFASYLWGLAADLFGKKQIIIISITGLSLTTTGFGFSLNVYFASAFRFLQGVVCSGVIVAAKAIIFDACDETNQAFAMTIVVTAWSLGMMIGPRLSGFFVFPAERWPKIIPSDSILGKFPVLLPNIMLSVIQLLTAIAIHFVVPKGKKAVAPSEEDVLNESVEDDIYEDSELSADEETDLERQPLNSKAKESPSGDRFGTAATE